MKIFGVGSVLEINGDLVTVNGFSKKCDSNGFYRYYVKFKDDPEPVNIQEFDTCKYNVVSV